MLCVHNDYINNKNEKKQLLMQLALCLPETSYSRTGLWKGGDFTLFMPFKHHRLRNQALARGCLSRHLLGEGILMSFRAWASHDQFIFYIQITKFIFRTL